MDNETGEAGRGQVIYKAFQAKIKQFEFGFYSKPKRKPLKVFT